MLSFFASLRCGLTHENNATRRSLGQQILVRPIRKLEHGLLDEPTVDTGFVVILAVPQLVGLILLPSLALRWRQHIVRLLALSPLPQRVVTRMMLSDTPNTATVNRL